MQLQCIQNIQLNTSNLESKIGLKRTEGKGSNLCQIRRVPTPAPQLIFPMKTEGIVPNLRMELNLKKGSHPCPSKLTLIFPTKTEGIDSKFDKGERMELDYSGIEQSLERISTPAPLIRPLITSIFSSSS